MVQPFAAVPNPHHYLPPTEEATLESLKKIFGEQEGEAFWNEACNQAGFPKPGRALTLDQLQTLARFLCQEEGVLKVVGFSLKTKINTYLGLLKYHGDS